MEQTDRFDRIVRAIRASRATDAFPQSVAAERLFKEMDQEYWDMKAELEALAEDQENAEKDLAEFVELAGLMGDPDEAPESSSSPLTIGGVGGTDAKSPPKASKGEGTKSA